MKYIRKERRERKWGVRKGKETQIKKDDEIMGGIMEREREAEKGIWMTGIE